MIFNLGIMVTLKSKGGNGYDFRSVIRLSLRVSLVAVIASIFPPCLAESPNV
ncbi:MAG: hypothetical protein ABR985_03590 [Methanotrichaceae archaeon]